MKLKDLSKKNFIKEVIFYNSKIYSIFLSEGDEYDELPMTIMINILDFPLFPTEDYHHAFIPWDKINKKLALDDIFETHFIELSKFRRLIKKGELDLNDPKVRLLLLLNESTDKNLIRKVINMDKHANSIYEKAVSALQNKKEYLAYIRAEQAELDYKAQIRYAEEKGEEVGLKKGEEVGIEKGKIEGKLEGKLEEKMEIAIKLKKLDRPINEIAEITGLPVEEIKKL